jgi:hypothetical protein
MPDYAGKYLKVTATEPTNYDRLMNAPGITGDGVLAAGVPVAGVVPATSILDGISLETELQPQSPDIINQVRIGLPYKSGLALYFKFLPANMRGGLQQALTMTPDPTSLTNRFLGHYTDSDSPAKCPRFQVWFTFGKYPGFAIANHSSVAQKAILTFKIRKLKVIFITKEEFDKAVASGVRWHPILAEDALVL